MKRWLAITFIALFGLAGLVGNAAAEPPIPLLWKAKGEQGTTYLLGSFHLLKADDYPLHPALEAAYASADRLVFELDPAEMTKPGIQAEIQAIARFDDGRTLRQVISKETADKLQAFMGGSEAAMAGADPFKPWFMGMNLAVGAMTSIGLNPQLGLDQHFMSRAAEDGKPVAGLETMADQMNAMDSAPMEEQEQMLADSLGPLSEMRERIMELHSLWRAGNAQKLEAAINNDMATKTPQMYLLLNRERNLKWLPQVQDMLKEKDTTLVIVGAMHLIGPDGLVELLQAKGVSVERVIAE